MRARLFYFEQGRTADNPQYEDTWLGTYGEVALAREVYIITLCAELTPTEVFFNLNPNPVGVGETLTLKGIRVDEYSNSLGNETVELYARPLAGSWMFITSVTTNTYGIFTWQAQSPEQLRQAPTSSPYTTQVQKHTRQPTT